MVVQGRRAPGYAAAALVVVVGVTVLATTRHTATKPPVELPGKVTGHSSATVKDGAVLSMLSERDRFGPTYVHAPAGAHFTVHLQNEGFHAHTFTSPQLGVNVVLAPGAAVDVPVTMPTSPGTVRFECTLHVNIGMQGAFVIH